MPQYVFCRRINQLANQQLAEEPGSAAVDGQGNVYISAYTPGDFGIDSFLVKEVPVAGGYKVNNVVEGEEVTFTPQAKWSDGAVRPMLNQDSTYLKGTWTSSNPFIMTINQQGQAYAYGAGTATIRFKSSTGVSFSPWTMTVTERYTGAI